MAKSVLITGGSRGAGAAAVRRFAEAGYRVAFTYRRSPARARELAAGTGALAIRANAASPEETASAVAAVIERYRRIDVLINNAGVVQYGALEDALDADYRRVMGVNLYGAFCAMRAVIPHMRARGGGCIVNVSALRCEQGAAGASLYCAAKAALNSLTKSAAKELAGDGIRVNGIAPGPMATGMNACLSPQGRASVCARAGQAELLPPEAAAEAMLFLAGDASAGITGQILRVSGDTFERWVATQRREDAHDLRI